MPEYLTPGVYMEEIEMGPKPIEGVSTSTAGFIGVTLRGPLRPRLVTSFEEFKRVFGGFTEDSYLPYAIQGFFTNGGKRTFVSRVVGEGTKTAQAKIKSSKNSSQDILQIEANGPGKWAQNLIFRIDESSQYDEAIEKRNDLFKLSIRLCKRNPDGSLNTEEVIEEESFDPISTDLTSPYSYKKTINGISNLILMWGTPESKGVKVLPKTNPKDDWAPLTMEGENNVPEITLKSADGKNSLKIIAKNEDVKNNQIFIRVVDDKQDPKKFDLIIKYFEEPTTNPNDENAEIKSHKGLTIRDDFSKLKSDIITVEKEANGKKPEASDNVWNTLSNMDEDPKVKLKDYDGGELKIQDPVDDKNTITFYNGFKAFVDNPEISICCAPGVPDDENFLELQKRVITHCENTKDRFGIIQKKREECIPSQLGTQKPIQDSKYAATYVPWINILDPLTDVPKIIPPCGHIAGIYARSDTERGVHKAPANEVIRGITSLQSVVSKETQAVLNPVGINVLRSFPGKGPIVWGARTISSDPAWKYLNVRRLFIFLEKSIERATQWVVFEPNNEMLWSRTTATIKQFLTGVWRTGALMGTTADEAFFVRCDRTTMTQDDIDNGRLVCIIGVAPTKPAEFVIFRLAQTKAGATLEEM